MLSKMGPSDGWQTTRSVTSTADCFFYHTMELPTVGTVHGQWDLRGQFRRYIGNVNLRGKTVLDVGTASGFLSFEAEAAGAARVVSFDISDAQFQHLMPFRSKLYFSDHEAWRSQQNAGIERWKNAYWLAHRLLGSKAKVYYGNIYALPDDIGAFDVAIIGSVVEHLSDQVTALASIARVTSGTIVLVTPILEQSEPIARFHGRASHPDEDYTWWTYSRAIYDEVLAMLGFRIVTAKKEAFDFAMIGRRSERHVIVATRI